MPTNLGNVVLSVTGLTNTDRPHPNYVLPHRSAGNASPEYGGGPTGSGLTPSQDVSLYGGNGTQALGPKGQGKGATLAVFELSGYTQSDIAVFEHQFFGPSENVPLVNINVDGGSITPNCPDGDVCADPADFSGDIEVEADIETQIAMAPKINRVLVYDAPNDETGATSIDEYFKIAQDNLADSISTSWGLCEQDTGIGAILAESIAFTQMALQGQSIFASSGDEGAFDCLLSDGTAGSLPRIHRCPATVSRRRMHRTTSARPTDSHASV